MANETINAAATLAALAGDASRPSGAASIGYKPPTGDGTSVQTELDNARALSNAVTALNGIVAIMNGDLGAHSGTGTAFAQLAALLAYITQAESDIDTLEALVGTQTGTGTVFHQLAELSTGSKYIHSRLVSPAASSGATINTTVAVLHEAITIDAIKILFTTRPICSTGDYTMSVTYFDTSVGLIRNLISTAHITCDTALEDGVVYNCTLTATASDLNLSADDYIYVTITAGTSGFTSGDGGRISIKYHKTPA